MLRRNWDNIVLLLLGHEEIILVEEGAGVDMTSADIIDINIADDCNLALVTGNPVDCSPPSLSLSLPVKQKQMILRWQKQMNL